jgi:hypothetical protein
MTEAEWLACDDPKPMLRYLIGTNEPRVQAVESFPDSCDSDRKLRVFACACYHRISHVLPDPVARATVRIAEQFADGAANVSEFLSAESVVRRLSLALEPQWRASDGAERIALHPTHAALALAGIVCWWEPQKAAWYAASNAHLELPYLANPDVDIHSTARWQNEVAEKRAQCQLLRDIFGNPFRPVTFSQEWRTDTALSLARQMYESRDFGAMPILADALQDAGCDNEDILNHCRDTDATHVRGCWVVDLVLGKS